MPKISAVLPSSLSEEITRRAHLNDRSFSAEIRQAVRAYLQQASPLDEVVVARGTSRPYTAARPGSSSRMEGS
jgi:hypothetical protein